LEEDPIVGMHESRNKVLQPTADRSHDAVIHVYDDAGKLSETHKASGRVQRAVSFHFNA
jgi:hypothetical protein